MFFITSLVLLFILKIRFPDHKPISNILVSRYGAPVLRLFRKLEGHLRSKEKIACDLEFLETCYNYKTMPKFLRIILYKRVLERSNLCKQWQLRLLQNEIKQKRKELGKSEENFTTASHNLREAVSWLDFSCIRLWLQRKQKNIARKVQKVHKYKLNKLRLSPLAFTLNPTGVIFNISDRILSSKEKHMLLLGLDFSLPVTKLNFHKYFLQFEKCYNIFSNITIYNSANNAANNFKTSLSNIAHKYFYNFKPHRNLCPLFKRDHFTALKSLAADKTLYVTKPDKGQGVVLLKLVDYVNKIGDVINDMTEFCKVNSDEKKLIIQLEDKLNNQLRIMKDSKAITPEFYTQAISSGSQLGSLYGLPEVHKKIVHSDRL